MLGGGLYIYNRPSYFVGLIVNVMSVAPSGSDCGVIESRRWRSPVAGS